MRKSAALTDTPPNSSVADTRARDGLDSGARGVSRPDNFFGGKGSLPGLRVGGRVVAFLTGSDFDITGLVGLPVKALLRAGGRAAGMGVEPGIDQLAVRDEHLAARFSDGLANAIVDGGRIVGLRFLHVGGDVRAGIAAFFFLHELQHERAGENGLRLERLERPVAAHFARKHAAEIILERHGFNLFGVDDVNLEGGLAVIEGLQLFRQTERARGVEPLRLGAGAGKQRHEQHREQAERFFHDHSPFFH